MTRFLAQWWAKRKYIFSAEVDAATHELHAALSAQRAQEARAMIAQLNKEAEEIEENIKRVAEMEEKGYWLCENGHEEVGPTKEYLETNGKVPAEKRCFSCSSPAKFIKRSLMSGQEQYESDQERKEAEKVAESKRQAAKQQEEEAAKGGEDTVKHFKREAARSRELAERLRQL